MPRHPKGQGGVRIAASTELDELYQQVILDHNRSPRNRGALPEATHAAEGHNPLCGDEVTVFLTVEHGTIRDVRFEGTGCAISMASASLMTEAIKGCSVEAVEAMVASFREALTSNPEAMNAVAEAKPELRAFEGVREFPIRVKCATLPWHTVAAALRGSPIHNEEERA